MDVRDLQPRGYGEELLAIRADGRSFSSKHVDVSDGTMLFHGLTKTSLAKSEVKAVYYIRSKPLTADQKFLAEENAVYLDPKLWFNGAFLGKIRVLVYDRSKPEDDSDLNCAARR